MYKIILICDWNDLNLNQNIRNRKYYLKQHLASKVFLKKI